ncbi:MAG: 2-phospho-L-lactate transferase [Ilumatobacteraceae bacterium]|nr:2-phospho-L-lactate transferase [Ilumatobacteraceae bacterium]
MITVVSGGVGAARLLRGAALVVPADELTTIVNTGDDTVMHGLAISPDLDTVTYTVSGAIDAERGWGLADEAWTTMQALERFADVRPASSRAGENWFGLGNRDLATHFYRTTRLAEGATLADVTAEIVRAFGIDFRVIPMSNERVSTIVTLTDGSKVSFQEYFVKLRHDVPVRDVDFDGADRARPLGLDELRRSQAVVIAPSNPIVSIGPMRALRDFDATLAARRDTVVAVSPIVAGAALKGPADRMLVELGHEASVVGVARLYAPIAGTLIVDTADAALAPQVEAAGMRCVVADTVMKTPAIAAELTRTCLAAVGVNHYGVTR